MGPIHEPRNTQNTRKPLGFSDYFFRVFRVIRGFSTGVFRLSDFDFRLSDFRRRRLLSLFLVPVLAAAAAGCSKEAKRTRYLANADRDFAAGQYQKAEIQYRKVLQVAPSDPAAISRLGIIYHDQGRLPQALAYLKKAAELAPDNPDVRLKLSLTELSLGGFKEARENAERVLQKQPGQDDALQVLAQTTLTRKDAQNTLQQIIKMRQQDKDRPGYHLALATLYLRLGQITNVAPELNQALALDPKFPATQTALGSVYWQSNDLTRAEAAFKAGAELSPLRSPRRLKYADFKLKTGFADGARKILEDLTRKAPDYLPAWNFLAQIAFSQNRLDDCAAILKRVLAQDAVNYQAVMLSVEVKLKQNEIAQATEELVRLAEVYRRSPEVHLRLAQCYRLNGENAKAEAAFRQTLVINTNSPEAILGLADLSIRRGQPGPAASSLERLVKQRPDLPQAHLLLAAAYAAQRNLDQALAVYRRMEKLFPKAPQVPLLMANVLARQNNHAEARKACERALELAPDSLAPLEQLVALDLAEKQPQAALGRVNQQIERRPATPELQILLARIYVAQTNYPQAETALLKAIEMAPDLRAPYVLLSQIYVTANKSQEALAKLNSFVARTNDAAALMQIGLIQDSLKNYAAARDAYEKVLSINPKVSIALNNLAYLYSEKFNEIDKAVELAEQARRFYPADPSVADTLGWILYRRGDYPKALTLLSEAAAAAPNEPEIQYHLGMVRYKLGQEAPARVAFESALDGDKDYPGKDDARRRLAILAVDPKAPDPDAQSLLEKRVAEDPGDSIALARLADVFNRNGKPDKALKAYEQALAQKPKDAYILASLARLYAAPGSLSNPKKALDLAKDAHAAAPDDASITQLLGHLVCQSGDYKWASSLLQEAALKLPDQPALLHDLARSYYGLGQLPAAETALQQALKGTAAFDEADEAKRLLSMIVAYRDSAQRPAIASQLQAILKADPNYIPALMVNSLLQQEKGSFQDARKTLDQVLAINPLFVPATRDLAVLCFDRFPAETRTTDLATKARQSFPDDPNLARVLGVLAYRRADYPAAARFLKQGLQTRKNDAELLYYLGMAQYQTKSPAESKQSLKRALELNLAPQLATEAKRILAELK